MRVIGRHVPARWWEWALAGPVLLVGAVLGTARTPDDPTPRADAPGWNARGHVPLDRFVIQSHRGAGELEADNTREAFELGWKLGTVPEADLRVSKDGVIVAFHDDDFKKLVKGAGPDLAAKGVKDLTWAELQALDVGAWKGEAFAGRRVPRLTDIYRLMAGRPERRLYLDIKEMDLKKLAAEVTAARVGAQVIVASSRYAVVAEWKALVPESGTLLWMGGAEDALEKRLAELRKAKFAGITQLQVHVRTKAGTGGAPELTPSPAFLVKTGRELREHGVLFQTLPWGAADPKLYWRLLDLGVASFATDHPAVTRDAVRTYYEQKVGPRP